MVLLFGFNLDAKRSLALFVTHFELIERFSVPTPSFHLPFQLLSLWLSLLFNFVPFNLIVAEVLIDLGLRYALAPVRVEFEALDNARHNAVYAVGADARARIPRHEEGVRTATFIALVWFLHGFLVGPVLFNIFDDLQVHTFALIIRVELLAPWTGNLTLGFALAAAHVPLPEVVRAASLDIFAIIFVFLERNAFALLHVPTMIRLTLLHLIVTEVDTTILLHAFAATARLSLESRLTCISTHTIFVPLLTPRLPIVSQIVLHYRFFDALAGVGGMESPVLAAPQSAVSTG